MGNRAFVCSVSKISKTRNCENVPRGRRTPERGLSLRDPPLGGYVSATPPKGTGRHRGPPRGGAPAPNRPETPFSITCYPFRTFSKLRNFQNFLIIFYKCGGFQRNLMILSRDIVQKPHFGPNWGPNLGQDIFFRKSGFVTLNRLLRANLMQKIRKI